MPWPVDSQVTEYGIRVTAAFLLTLILSRTFRDDLRLRSWAWLVCFTVPLLLFLPLPRLVLPILESVKTQTAFSSRVYELDPRFSQLKPTYLDDPGPGWVLLAVSIAAMLGLAVLLFRWVGTLRIVRSGEQVVDEDLVALLYELGQQHGLSDVPVLKRSDQIDSPCIWGVTQPVILVPTSLENALSESEWRLVLDHEISHLAQRDTFRLLAFSVVRHAFWWNPLIWFAYRDAMLVQEQTVDSKIVEGKETGAYARLLTLGAAPATGISRLRLFGQGHLLTRVVALTSPSHTKSSTWHLTSVLAFGFVLFPIDLVPANDPDSERIGYDEVLFQSNRTGVSRLWRMASDGRGQHPMPEFFREIATPSVSPDGKWLAYCRRGERKEDIYVARLDGNEERLIVSSPDRDYEPAWSPDGTKLAFCTLATGNWEIGLADVKTAVWRFLTKDGRRNLEPDWHPRGERIIFSSHRSGSQKLWSMNLDGTGLLQLTRGPWEDTAGRFSPDGRYVLFASYRRWKYDVCLLDLVSGQVRPLSRLSQLDTGEARFADGGASVLCSARDGLDPQVGKFDLRGARFSILTEEGFSNWPATR